MINRIVKRALISNASATTGPSIRRELPKRKTPNGISRLKQLSLQNHQQILKIGVRARGCSGNEYMLDWISLDAVKKQDEVVVQDGVKVLVEARALLTLIGSEMDFVEDLMSSRFVFENPNAKGACGCGQSFMT